MTNPTHRLWRWLGLIFVLSFGALGYLGWQIYLTAPPIPKPVVSADGEVLFTGEQIQHGQQAWLAAGGQQLGTVWGHGSYVAPDWSADWLHREAVALQAIRAPSSARPAGADAAPTAGAPSTRALQDEMRRNTYDEASGDVITVSHERAQAIRAGRQPLRRRCSATTPALAQAARAVRDDRRRAARGRRPPGADRLLLLDRLGRDDRPARRERPFVHQQLAARAARRQHDDRLGARCGRWSASSCCSPASPPCCGCHGAARTRKTPRSRRKADPLLGAAATPSMKATRKYFFAVIGLMLLQIGMGAITAHYAVEGQAFFGIPLAEVLPYVVSRTVHTQVGIFWIATAWLATGLYIAPLLSGHEPKLQKLGVDVLFWALIVIVVGSTATGWLGTLQHRGVDFSFWIGNQGLEFTSMGRVWQLLLFVGLLFWVVPARPRPVAGAEEAVGDPRPDRHGVPVGDVHRRLLRHLARPGASTRTTR